MDTGLNLAKITRRLIYVTPLPLFIGLMFYSQIKSRFGDINYPYKREIITLNKEVMNYLQR